MSVQVVNVLPYAEASDPSLLVQVKIDYQPGYRAFLGLSGTVRVHDGKRLGALEPVLDEQSKFEELLQPFGHPGHSGMISRTALFVVRLSQYGLSHIESIRQSDRKKDVALIFDFLTVYLQPEYLIAAIQAVKLDQNQQSNVFRTFDSRRPEKSLLVYEPTIQGVDNELQLLRSGNPGTGSIGKLTREFERGIEHTIRASDWVLDFAPVFGLGKSILVEVPEIEMLDAFEGLGQRVNEAIRALPKMKDNLIRGNWTECVEDSRPIIELLNKKDILLKLIEDDGLTKEAGIALVNGLSSTFEYASKFHHRIERDGTTVSYPMKANKEDAYLAYLNAVSLVNLIAEKSRKQSQSKN